MITSNVSLFTAFVLKRPFTDPTGNGGPVGFTLTSICFKQSY